MFAVATWILLCIISALAGIYMFITNILRKRRPLEPPIAKGRLVWGNAVEFGTDAISLLHKCKEEYGEIFTIRIVNQYMTIIMDPHCYEAMSKERNFDFDPIQKQVNWNVFSFVLKEPKKMIKDTGKTVRGAYLNRGLHSYESKLNRAFENVHPSGDLKSTEWATDGLRLFAAKTIFNALFNSIFGSSSEELSMRTYENFEVFHKYFNYFWLGMPKSCFPTAMKALQQLIRQPLSEELLAREDCSDYIKAAVNYMREMGQSEADIIGHNLVYLHVNYNTFRLAFWVLHYMLEEQKAREAVKEEIAMFINERLDKESNTATFTHKDLEAMPVLDSVIQETCRLASGVFMVRYVTDDTLFKDAQGKEHLIRKGDRVSIYPPAIHKNEEIFTKPLEFQYDRFVDAKFYKDGHEIKHPVIAFGSLCPGKRMALLQLKWYIINTLTRYDMKLQDGEHAEYAYEYHGHEILPPKKDVKMDFRQNTNVPSLVLE